MKDDFKFHIPITLKKAKSSDGGDVQEMILEGLAGDGTKDTAQESLTYDGFDLDRMFYINWEHSKEPDDVIGVILQKQLQKGGKLFIKGKLFNGHAKAESAYKLQEFLEKEGHNLGFSVEGKVIERDPINPKIVRKAELYGVALCKVPVNPVTYAKIAKAFTGEEDIEDEEEENEEVEKMTTADIAPAMPESVEKKPKQALTKSQVYSMIFNQITTDIALADSVFNNLIKPISKMDKQPITEETLKKAQEILGLANETSASEEIKKGADMNVSGEENGGSIEALKKAMQSSRKDYLEKAKAYSDMCKAKGIDPEKDEEDEETDEMEKSIRPELFGDHIAGSAINPDLIKSAVSEAIEAKFDVLDKLEKSIEIRTKALGTLINSDREQIGSLQELLEKANSDLEKINDFNEDFRERLQIVERTPIKKAVTTENFKERFPENPGQNAGANTFNIKSREDRDRLAKSVDAVFGNDLSNPENIKVMEAVATLEMTGTIEPAQQALLKAKGYELISM